MCGRDGGSVCVTRFKRTQDMHPVYGGRHASGCWLVQGGRHTRYKIMFVEDRRLCLWSCLVVVC